MRTHSCFCIDCPRCGTHFESEKPDTQCPTCKVMIEVIWTKPDDWPIEILPEKKEGKKIA